jgi:KDO2-lipid IV(A) lauroyltransferase
VQPTLSHRLEYAAYRVARALLVLMPESVARLFGSFLGWVAGRLLGIRRGVVDANLQRAFPDRDAAWRRRTASRAWRHLGREAVATFRLAGETIESVRDRTDVDDADLAALRRYLDGGSGAILLTGHFGNWELAGAAIAARGVPMDAVAVRQKNPLFDAELLETRARLGMHIVDRDAAPRALLRGLRRGRVAGIVGDQSVQVGGILVDFFGHEAATPQGAAVLSLKTGVPIFAGVAIALPGPRWRYRIRFEEVTIERSGDFDADVRRLTQAHTAVLEAAVREYPEQYFWPHKRWKKRRTAR